MLSNLKALEASSYGNFMEDNCTFEATSPADTNDDEISNNSDETCGDSSCGNITSTVNKASDNSTGEYQFMNTNELEQTLQNFLRSASMSSSTPSPSDQEKQDVAVNYDLMPGQLPMLNSLNSLLSSQTPAAPEISYSNIRITPNFGSLLLPRTRERITVAPKEGKFQCTFGSCNKIFECVPNLKRHLKIHEGKPYFCIYCTKRFNRGDNTTRHQRTCRLKLRNGN